LASSPLIQKAGPVPQMIRGSDGRLAYPLAVPTPAKRL
jgi:hypothetical protein